MNRKLIFTDLDGTLLDSDKKISNETEKIIKALVSQGHYFCFVTGRSMHDALPFYKQLGLDTICICNNGAAIHNPADEHFSDIFFPINKDVFFKLYQCNDLLDQLEYFIIKTRHHTFTNKIPTERKLIENFKIWFHLDFADLKKAKKESLIIADKSRKSDILSIIIVLKPNADVEHVYYLIKSLTNNLLISRWSIDNRGHRNDGQLILELNHNFANKYNSLRFAQSYYDVLNADCYVFGDGTNDMQMLHKVENSYVMKNASSDAYTMGHNITKYDNNHDGVAKTLQELFMPK